MHVNNKRTGMYDEENAEGSNKKLRPLSPRQMALEVDGGGGIYIPQG